MTPQWGIATDSADVLSRRPGHGGRKVETVAVIEEDFSKLTPEQRAKGPAARHRPDAIDLRKLSRGDKPVKEKFTHNPTRGKSPLVIRAISCPDTAVGNPLPKDRTIKPGKVPGST